MADDKSTAKVRKEYAKICNTIYTVTLTVSCPLQRPASGDSP